jgi:hypothetical protein
MVFCEETNHGIQHSNNICLYAPGRLLLMYLGLDTYLVFSLFLVENAPISSGPIWKEIEEKN